MGTADGAKVDLFSHSDGSGRQEWNFVYVRPNTYRIEVSGGTVAGAKMLSCRADGFVDLFGLDDGSGRQEWTLVYSGAGWYHILVAGGTNSGKSYLSCTAAGKVDLF